MFGAGKATRVFRVVGQAVRVGLVKAAAERLGW